VAAFHPPPDSSPGDAGALLNEHQQRHFEVFLSMLQDSLAEIEALAASEAQRQDALVSYDDDIPEEFEKEIQPLLASLREDIGELVELLEIPRRHRPRVRMIRALVTSEIVRLDDSYAEKLRGYGPVDPKVRVQIDPILDRMRIQLQQLLRATDVTGTEKP
jgi:hypothetical protein